MADILTGFEGLVTPRILFEKRAERRAEQLKQAGQQTGRNFGARAVGMLLGSLITRALPPGEEQKRAESAQKIVQDAQARADEQEFPGELGRFDKRIAAVSTAIQDMVANGQTREADTLRSNLQQLRNQRFEQRVELAKLAGVEEKTARTKQIGVFDELGDAVTIIRAGTTDPISAMLRNDGTARFTDEEGLVQDLASGPAFRVVKIQGSADDVSPDRVLIRKAVQKMNAMHGLVSVGRQMRQAIIDDPGSTTFTANVGAFMNSAAVNARAFITQNKGISVDTANRTRVERVLAELGLERGVMQARSANIAYMIATSNEDGRLSDQDIERAAKIAGFGVSDPAARVAILDDLMLNKLSEFEFLGSDPIIRDLPQYNALTEDFTGFLNDRRDFFVPIPGRDEDENDPTILFQDERGTIR